MQFWKSFKTNLLFLVTNMLIICLTYPIYAHVYPALGNPDYTYYGVVPSKIYRYNLTDINDRNSVWRLDTGSTGNSSLIAISAAEDDTNIEVYDLTLDRLVSEVTINSMEKHFVLLSNGTVFKVVSDKQVSVLLLNYHSIPNATAREGPLPRGSYLSTDGMYVGKEFVFMGSSQGINAEYTILALEKTTVTVTRDDGDDQQYSLDANSYKNIILNPFRVYEFESTGNIKIQSVAIPAVGSGDCTCFPAPSAEGGFVGTFFLTRSIKGEWGWDEQRDYGYRIMASEDTEVRVYDLETKQLMTKFTVTGGTGTAIKPTALAIAVQSDKPITLTFIHNGSIEITRSNLGGMYTGYANGVMFIGIQPSQDTMIHLPTEAFVEAYFFANEETQLTIDGLTQTVPADTFYMFTQPGTHLVQADHNVVLQINFWSNEPDNQGLEYVATIVPSIETVNLSPTVTLTPLEGFPIMYVIIGAGVAAVAAVVGLMVMRKRSKPR
jgi:hypothetical protein